MDIVKEPVQEWGGEWTETKLKAFESYVNAYLKIMNKQKNLRTGQKLFILMGLPVVEIGILKKRFF